MSLQILFFAWSRQLISVSLKWQIGLLLPGILVLLEVIAFRLLSSLSVEGRIELYAEWQSWLTKLGPARLLILGMLILLPAGLFLHVDEAFTTLLLVRIFVVWILIIPGAEILRSFRPEVSWPTAAAGAALLISTIYRLGLLAQEISTYPFSLGWSEASRYYYASLFAARRIYGFPVPPSVLHPSRYLMQSVPFLIPSLPLVAHRIWQVLLWLSTTAATGYLLARRVGVRSGVGLAALITLAVLYLFQGPVYYHLLVMVILVLWLFDGDRPWRSLGVILLASAWAGISRINWYPVPAMLGAVLYSLEIPREKQSLGGYAGWPVLWIVLGSVTAFLSQAAYISLSGQPGDLFSSSLSSELLWYRLLPNETYPPGVLLAILLASFPTLLLVWFNRSSLRDGLSWPRSLGLAAIASVLLAGGLLVSVKIGGGSNLHNLDAYLVVLGVIATYVYFGRIADEAGRRTSSTRYEPFFLPLFIAIPLIFTINQGQPRRLPDEAVSKTSLEALQERLEDSRGSGQRILFISQRHLVTFGLVENVELVPGYETVFLMEMAMAGNEIYLSRFHSDLAEHRFDLIVVDPLSTRVQGRTHSFGEENDAWVEEVSLPVLCHYAVIDELGVPPLQILAPRDGSCE
jgi:hypothetical protein